MATSLDEIEFATAFTVTSPPAAKTTVELSMMKMSQDIREKPGWAEKIKDVEIVNRWTEEALEFGLKEDQIDYVMSELKYYASLSKNGITVGAIDGTWQSDNLIESTLKEEFVKRVGELLEMVDESARDYHPWSNKQVIDLVHPSLFCYVKDVTKIDDASEKIVQLESGDLSNADEVNKYQWLPSEFFVDNDGKVTINSYINNLNPKKHEALYPLIGRIFEKFIPLFDRVLSDLLNPYEKNIMPSHFEYYKEGDDYCPFDDNEVSDYDEKYEVWSNGREIQWPKVPKFIPPTRDDNKTREFNLRGRNLQVIVKIASIELTPENPGYPGGSWHVEGTHNEAIVATGIYYYSSCNITESRLLFRQAVQEPDYMQYDDYGVKKVYGLANGEYLNQKLGSIVCIEDRCIAFPNSYQHYVAPFELIDKTTKGHRKILAFFLVDPTVRILSTKHVKPQQSDWIENESDQDPARKTMTLEVARMYREKLMKSRKFIPTTDDDRYDTTSLYEREFSLCEH